MFFKGGPAPLIGFSLFLDLPMASVESFITFLVLTKSDSEIRNGWIGGLGPSSTIKKWLNRLRANLRGWNTAKRPPIIMGKPDQARSGQPAGLFKNGGSFRCVQPVNWKCLALLYGPYPAPYPALEPLLSIPEPRATVNCKYLRMHGTMKMGATRMIQTQR